MKKRLLPFLLCAVFTVSAQQIDLWRIESMPNMPSPYQMRDWKKVALDYDALVFNTGRTGTYLPLTKISTSNGINYPVINPIRMDTYVGQSDHGMVAEAINILPAVVGATLVGVDKTMQLNTNWVVKLKEFFNIKNGELVYLNSYSSSTGNDWWYEVMPNVFFYQLYDLYPQADPDFSTQFVTIADRQLNVLYKLGGFVNYWKAPLMNYRAFNLLTGKPLVTSVPEPETAGSIAWILYQAYTRTGQPKYLYGAELALDFLQNWVYNPSYEIQLPYGIAAAARMNALEGTDYDLSKFLNWTFTSGSGTLRGWGTIVGNWNGYDVSGLIGEANDVGDDYAFSMNGFQHAAALAPVAKYDKRYARALGKWMLNLANASRLFYANALPSANQEQVSFAWSTQYDTTACIPYESMKQSWNDIQPCAMGDAVKGGWAATNLSLYSGSSVGYLASIIEKTNVEGILRIDLNKTDFSGANTYPAYLYYNPHGSDQLVDMVLPAGNFDVYDAISETVLRTNVHDTVQLSIPTDSVRLTVIYPTGKTTVVKGRFKTVDGAVIDFHTHNDFSTNLRIKAFTVSDTLVEKLDSTKVFCVAENNAPPTTTYRLFQDGVVLATNNFGVFTWRAPAATGLYRLTCEVVENGDTARSISIPVTVADNVYPVPVISLIGFSEVLPLDIDTSLLVGAGLNTLKVQYDWSCEGGTLSNTTTINPTWHSPTTPGIYYITLTVTNPAGTCTYTEPVLVKDLSITAEPTPLIYYPLNGDTKNGAQDAFHAVSVNAVPSVGADGRTDAAYQFPSSASYLYTPNEAALNFQNQVAVSFWVKPDALPLNEQFILSHGSWEERYKVSITPEKKVRWTVKTNRSIADVDDNGMLDTGHYIHFTAQYTGYSLELYRNGHLVDFKALAGTIKTTTKSITIARKDEGTSEYNFHGSVDEVRIYSTELPQRIIRALPTTYSLKVGDDKDISAFRVYPNPSAGDFFIHLPPDMMLARAQVYDITGQLVYSRWGSASNLRINGPDGIYFLLLQTTLGKTFRTRIIKKL
jgi:PKD repeat protein